MRTGKELIGKPVYSLDEGRLLGMVKDLFVDLELNVVSGLYLGSEGIISRKILAILRESITVFGIDAVFATTSDTVKDSSELKVLETWLRREDLQGRDVDTPGGTRVGNIGDILIDENAKIVGFWLSRVKVAGPIAEHRQVMNAAVIDTGDKDGTMTIDLSKAEQQPDKSIPEPAETQEKSEQEETEEERAEEEPAVETDSANEEES